MSKKQPDPTIDFGFHAVIPRALRTEYKSGETKLTPVQKWLYVCLKDLCGDHGTCYRALRTLAEETDMSTGMLSESIPLLHKAGLIHAEKKKRSTGGKEVWHITIVDIWQKNAKLHPTKRSHSEQRCSPTEQRQENVHDVNKGGGECSPTEQERSLCEPECSLCETEVITSGSTTSEVSSGGENTESNSTPTPPAHTHSFSSQEQRTPQPKEEKPAQPPPGTPAPKTAHTPEAEAIRALYDSIALGTGKLSGHPKWDWTAMEEMVAAHPTEEEIRLVYLHLKAKQQVDIRQKCTIQAVWENWSTLGTLKKPVFSNSSPPRSTVVDEEPERPFLKPSDTHKPRYGALAVVGGGR